MNKVIPYGIRHHGPGSAYALQRALDELRPDAIVIEMPEDAQELLHHIQDEENEPPFAITVTLDDHREMASNYPFSSFSPEYRAMLWAKENDTPVVFADAPASIYLSVRMTRIEDGFPPEEIPPWAHIEPLAKATEHLPENAGVIDAGSWWESWVEMKSDPDKFPGILEYFMAIRLKYKDEIEEDRFLMAREAFMRDGIRACWEEGLENVAFVSGAFHSPALFPKSALWRTQDEDKQAIEDYMALADSIHNSSATMIRFTNQRLANFTGYGAGVDSPGFFSMVYDLMERGNEDRIVETWLTKIAHAARKEGYNTSPAEIIDAVRTANTLIGIRGGAVSLETLEEVATAVFFQGNVVKSKVITHELRVGQRMGYVGNSVPKPPLLHDIERNLHRLQSKDFGFVSDRRVKIDVRDAKDSERSRILWRMVSMGINYGQISTDWKPTTIIENWEVDWFPGIEMKISDKAIYGVTLEVASRKYMEEQVANLSSEGDIGGLAKLIAVAIGCGNQSYIPLVVQGIRDCYSASSVDEIVEAARETSIILYGSFKDFDVGEIVELTEEMAKKAIRLIKAFSRNRGTDESGIEHGEKALNTLLNLIYLCENLYEEADVDLIDPLLAEVLVMAQDSAIAPLVAGFCLNHSVEWGQILISKDPSKGEMVRIFNYMMSAFNLDEQALFVIGVIQSPEYLANIEESEPYFLMINNWMMGLTETQLMTVLPSLHKVMSDADETTRKKIKSAAESLASTGSVK